MDVMQGEVHRKREKERVRERGREKEKREKKEKEGALLHSECSNVNVYVCDQLFIRTQNPSEEALEQPHTLLGSSVSN